MLHYKGNGYRYENPCAGYGKYGFAWFLIAAIHINTSTVWVQFALIWVISARVLFLGKGRKWVRAQVVDLWHGSMITHYRLDRMLYAFSATVTILVAYSVGGKNLPLSMCVTSPTRNATSDRKKWASVTELMKTVYIIGCPPSVIGPSLLLLPVLGTVWPNMSRPHPLCLVFRGCLKAFLFRHAFLWLSPQLLKCLHSDRTLKSFKCQTFVIMPVSRHGHSRGAQVHGMHQAASHIPALNLPSHSRYSLTDHERMEGWVSTSPGCKEQLAHGCEATACCQRDWNPDLAIISRAC